MIAASDIHCRYCGESRGGLDYWCCVVLDDKGVQEGVFYLCEKCNEKDEGRISNMEDGDGGV